MPRGRSPYALAPLLVEEHPHGTVDNSYIVMLKSHTSPLLMENHMNFLMQTHQEHPLVADDSLETGLRHVWDSHIKGYAGTFSEKVIERIRQMPEVDYVEKDQVVRTLEVPNAFNDVKTQNGAPWVCSLWRLHAYASLMLGFRASLV